MFTHDGMVYASEPAEIMSVEACRSLGDGILLVTFSTGETRLLDAFELTSMPAFEALRDQDVLDALTIEDGVVTWNGGAIDIAPEAMYARSYEYQMTA